MENLLFLGVPILKHIRVTINDTIVKLLLLSTSSAKPLLSQLIAQVREFGINPRFTDNR